MVRYAFFLVFLICGTSLMVAQEAQQQAPETPPHHPPYRLMGKLHRPLGEVVKIQGKVVEGPFKGYEGGPNLIAHRINGKATQELIQIKIRPYMYDFGHDATMLPKLNMGEEYEFEGYETGSFVGIPSEAYDRAGIGLQTSTFYFSHTLVVYKGKQLPPLAWSPVDFIDRSAVIAGRAVSADGKSFIAGKGWQLQVNAETPWPEHYTGQEVEGFGVIRKTDKPETFIMEDAMTRLVHLKDQLGRKVSLRGTAWSLNGHWWFNYRGTKMYVEKMKELPGWNANLHGRPVLIEGILNEAELPSLNQITLKEDRDLAKNYIVRQARWKPLEALMSFELEND